VSAFEADRASPRHGGRIDISRMQESLFAVAMRDALARFPTDRTGFIAGY
jgi:hypothetical protein